MLELCSTFRRSSYVNQPRHRFFLVKSDLSRSADRAFCLQGIRNSPCGIPFHTRDIVSYILFRSTDVSTNVDEV